MPIKIPTFACCRMMLVTNLKLGLNGWTKCDNCLNTKWSASRKDKIKKPHKSTALKI